MFYGMALAVVENYPIEGFRLFDEMLFNGETQIAAPVVVMRKVSRHREYATGLFLQAGTYEGRPGKSLLVRVFQPIEISGNAVQKAKVFGRVENATEFFLDKVRACAALCE